MRKSYSFLNAAEDCATSPVTTKKDSTFIFSHTTKVSIWSYSIQSIDRVFLIAEVYRTVTNDGKMATLNKDQDYDLQKCSVINLTLL